MPKHLTDCYQTSIKGKEIEMNFTNINLIDLTHYDTDCFRGPSENADYVMNDENTTTE